MSATPWTVTSKKRKVTPAISSSGRKRQRRDDTPTTQRRQQTLTQAQWFDTSSSLMDEPDLVPIKEISSTVKPKLEKKRNSTLTQMDFLDRSFTDPNEDEIMMTGQEVNNVKSEIPQVDGTFQSPRKQRKRKILPVLKNESNESQEYQPSKRTRPKCPSEGGCKPRRTSRRLAEQPTVLSDPADNFDYFNQALAGASTPVKRKDTLEIRDSTEDGEVVDMLPSTPIEVLKTPAKKSKIAKNVVVIQSSQSPESLPPSVHRSAAGRNARTPLNEVSRNARVAHGPYNVYSTPPFAKCSPGGQNNSKLKKPRKAGEAKIDDSQTNVWSIQLTSSAEKDPRPDRDSSDSVWYVMPEGAKSLRAEIPSTSQVDVSSPDAGVSAGIDAARKDTDSLMKPIPSQTHDEKPAQSQPIPINLDLAPELDDVMVRDFVADHQIDERETIESLNAPSSITPKASKIKEDFIEDSDSDFGSPIQNDTQFVEELKHRTSSPALPATSEAIDSQELDAIPPPRLMRHPSPQTGPEVVSSQSGADTLSLPSLPPVASLPGFVTTRVPLNDIGLSSSPPLPSTKSATQRSIHPAPMPRPSQMSTQESTQGFGGSLFVSPDTPRATQRITIKDSSSFQLPMSQIPFEVESQSQLNIDLRLDEYGPTSHDREDYDLNPQSSVPQHEAAAGVDVIDTERIFPPSSTPPPTGPSLSTDDHDGRESQLQLQLQLHLQPNQQIEAHNSAAVKTPSVSPSPSPSSSPTTTKKQNQKTTYPHLQGYNNETQSNFTQGGHVSAAYIHRQREAGLLPKYYTPPPFKVPGYTRR